MYATLKELMIEFHNELIDHLNKISMPFEMIGAVTQWIMTFFVGYIDDKHIILNILDNYILGQTPSASFKILYSIILAFFQLHKRLIIELDNFELVD